VLAEFAGLTEVIATSAMWRNAHMAGVIEIVPAALTVLVVHDGTLDTTLLAPAGDSPPVAGDDATIVIQVDYDGADLLVVADACAVTPGQLVAMHTDALYTVAFCGFMPGFGYLVGLPPALHLPRRPTPRTRVPAGSVAIAAEFAGVYPREGPGGWHLLGHTDALLWDDDREPPALLQPGMNVRFAAR
jgi:KipI family sensor histidine kinase inhibitor